MPRVDPNQRESRYPSFLRHCPVYREYLRRGEAGELNLPPFHEIAHGEVFVQYGEIFCRVPGCTSRCKIFSNTAALRRHLSWHNYSAAFAPYGRGRLALKQREAVIDWYRQVIERSNDSQAQ
ncbi:hypothetical protein N7535_000653 [Penicillium sp. DV-2018c]|nr:hypothetical protein N7461_006095 [Penicillium sp. DV-2018c]KAJ5582033.1 hypothetical protein N7535_000653 [Penicillium sp. DV-2018c]